MSDISQRISKLTLEQKALLKARFATIQADDLRRISRRRDQNSYPMSLAQESLWLVNQLEPGPHYNDYTAFRITGSLNIAALEKAITEVLRRHEILRATIQAVDGRPVQTITPCSDFKLSIVDLQGKSEEQAIRLAREEAQLSFDLSQGPLVRAKLLRLTDDDYLMPLTMHHIVTDGWSINVFKQEVGALYEAFVSRKPSLLPELPIQYADYAAWQQSYLQEGGLEKQLAYWKEKLVDIPMLELPTDRPRPPVRSFNGARYYFELPATLTAILRDLQRSEDVTLYIVLLAAFKVLLMRYSGQADFAVGTVVAGRSQPEVQGLMGFFVNTLVLRTDLGGNPTFRELLGRVRETTLEAFAHQESPFMNVVKELRVRRSSSYSPLFQVMFSSQPPAATSVEGFSGLKLGVLDPDNQKSPFDLALQLIEGEQSIPGRFQYCTDIFDAETIERMLGHYRTLLEAIVANPDTHISDLPLLPEADRRQIIFEFNDTSKDYPTHICVHQLVEEQAARVPDALAVSFGEVELTYGELNSKANRLARHLRQLGVKAETMVGICAERSADWLVGLLGILKAGGAYVSLDPTYPAERIHFMIQDSQVPVLLIQKRLLNLLPQHNALTVLVDDDAEWKQASVMNLESLSAAENLCYAVYTSGSTGKPKAAVMSHRSLVNLALWHRDYYKVATEDRAIQIARMGFGAAVWEVWSYLCSGASIHILDEETRLSPDRLRDWIISNRITIGFLPPVLAEDMLKQQWPEDTALRAVLTGSDKLLLYPPESLPFKYFNHYGMTEATVISTAGEISPEANPDHPPVVGRPLSNYQIYLLDRFLQPVPIRVPGEIYVGGDGVARGYLNRPELTAEKFTPNPFSKTPGARLYRTGDLARYRPDGQLEFLGRIDFQIKIRGYRIELGEIETVLCQFPLIKKSVVTLKEDGSDEKRLVAYIATDAEELPIDGVRDFLRDKLPEYMIPASLVVLDEIPLTPNGKVDHRALPDPDRAATRQGQQYTSPESPTQEALAKIWSEVLRVDRVGIHDDFIQLGGHSLLATQVISRVRDTFEVDLPVRTVFERPTIKEYGELIEEVILDEVEKLTPEEARVQL